MSSSASDFGAFSFDGFWEKNRRYGGRIPSRIKAWDEDVILKLKISPLLVEGVLKVNGGLSASRRGCQERRRRSVVVDSQRFLARVRIGPEKEALGGCG
ncbi:hypothetical protein Tco_0785123 [Tanacetum coccineum]